MMEFQGNSTFISAGWMEVHTVTTQSSHLRDIRIQGVGSPENWKEVINALPSTFLHTKWYIHGGLGNV